jgi:hypothetical protein
MTGANGTDYTFMKTGRNSSNNNDNTDEADKMTQRVVALCATMLQHAVVDAATYCEHSGRKTVTKQDIHRALRYEARSFLEKVEDDEVDEVELELFGDESEEEDEDNEDNDDDEEEEDAFDAVPDDASEQHMCACQLCSAMDEIWKTWEDLDWSDPVYLFLKNCVDTTMTSE